MNLVLAHRSGSEARGFDPSDNRSESIDISVVIPAYFGAKTIADCLESVQRALRNHSAQIIVVESSGDATAEIVRTRFPDVLLIQSEKRLSAGAARNRGTVEARGKLVF